MNYNQIFKNFIKKVMQEGTYATREQVEAASLEMLDIITKNKDATPEELVEKAIDSNVEKLEEIRNNYPIPGYTVGMNVGNINVKMLGGNMDSFGRNMSEDALFDIASMTKFYTQIIAYNLIKEGAFSFSSKIQDLDSRFENLGDLTVGQVLEFAVEFRTNGRLSDKKTVEDALDCLYTMEVAGIDKYNYNDMGMMLLKEVMENVTNKSYQDLLDEYIGSKLKLNNTHLVVPEQKIEKITGSANASLGMVNDPSALSVGGYSGHAGIMASSDDLIQLGKGVVEGKVLPLDMLRDAYTPGKLKNNRGIMGNTYTSHKNGIDMSYVDILEPKSNFAIQGSTRVQMNIGFSGISTILLNPASMSLDKAKEEESKINERRISKGQNPLSLVKNFTFCRDNALVKYNLIDARLMAPSDKTVEPITTENARLALRLRLLNEVIHEYDREYNKEIHVCKNLTKK